MQTSGPIFPILADSIADSMRQNAVMSYIRDHLPPQYAAEVAGRRGKVANILAIHGIEPEIGSAHLKLYMTLMFGRSGVSRLEREAVALAVSSANRCHY